MRRNDGSQFVDVTYGRIPPPDIAPAQIVSKGDVDGGGDDDLLVARFGQYWPRAGSAGSS